MMVGEKTIVRLPHMKVLWGFILQSKKKRRKREIAEVISLGQNSFFWFSFNSFVGYIVKTLF